MLVGTIRNEIASCWEKAYASLPISNAKNLIFLDSEGAVIQFAKEVGLSFIPGDCEAELIAVTETLGGQGWTDLLPRGRN